VKLTASRLNEFQTTQVNNMKTYTLTIPGITFHTALGILNDLYGSMIYIDQDGNSRGEHPNRIHGPIEKLSVWPSDKEVTIVKD